MYLILYAVENKIEDYHYLNQFSSNRISILTLNFEDPLFPMRSISWILKLSSNLEMLCNHRNMEDVSKKFINTPIMNAIRRKNPEIK